MADGLYFNDSKDFTTNELNISQFKPGSISYGSLDFFSDAAHSYTNLPIIVARGRSEGPVLGILAVVHGNELQGIPVIHHLVEKLDPKEMKGAVVAVPVVNMPGYLMKQRKFIDNRDLNRQMPGKERGTPSEIFTYRLLNNVIKKFDYMIDIHTASFGRVNSHYIRCDLKHPYTRKMALLSDGQIILNTKQPSGTFRHTAQHLGIPTITVELGNPQRFQNKMINSGIEGIHNVMIDLGMIEGKIHYDYEPVICKTSYWMRVDTGGVLYVRPPLGDIVEEGEEVATLTDIFGRLIKTYKAPQRGIVIGKSTNPVTYTGGRILHLGIMGDIDEFVEEEVLSDDDEDY